MNLFRSEEHIKGWPQLNPASVPQGVIPLRDLATLYGTENRRHLLDGNYISHWLPQRRQERAAALQSIGKNIPFWLVVKS